MLDLMGEKFDMSFDEPETPHKDDPPSPPQINPESTHQTPPQLPLSEDLRLHTDPLSEPPSESVFHQSYVTEPQRRLDYGSDGKKHYESACDILQLGEERAEWGEGGKGEWGEGGEGGKGLAEGETGAQEAESEEEVDYYRSLNEKFEEALSKVGSKREAGRKEQFMERLEQYGKKRESELRSLRAEREKQELRQFKGKPLINSRSMQIIPHHQPIHQRYEAVLAERTRKVELRAAEKRLREQQMEEAVLREMQEYEQAVKEKLGTVRTEEEYYEAMKAWNEKKVRNIEMMAVKKEEGMRAVASFKPAINPRSDLMMKKKAERVVIYEKEPEVKRVAVDKNCTFKPNLNKTLKK